MTNIFFTLGGNVSVHLESDEDITLNRDEIRALQAHLPGLMPADAIVNPDILIRHRKAAALSFSHTNNIIDWQQDWQGKVPADFTHVLYAAARLTWLKAVIFPVHASCLADETGNGILLAGASGAGKSTVSLCAARRGYKIFSGDKTLLRIAPNGYITAIAGTRIMTIPASDADRWEDIATDGYESGDRYSFTLKPTAMVADATIKIKSILQIRRNDGQPRYIRLQGLSALHNLYPQFLDMARGDVLVAGGKALFDGSLPLTLRRELAAKMTHAMSHLSVATVIGDLNYIVDSLGHEVT